MAAKLAYRFWRKTFRHSLPGKEIPLLKSALKTTLKINNRRIQIYSWGSGPKILLCPGWNGRATQFHKLIGSLTEQGYEVIGVDPPGHGLSSGKDTSILEIAQIINSITDRYKPIHAFVGHSAGAMAGFSAIATNNQLNRAVFIAMPTNSQDLLENYCAALNLDQKTCHKIKQLFQSFHGQDAFTRSSPVLLTHQIQIPTLLIHDSADTAVPHRLSEELVKSLPHSQLFISHRYGHFRVLNAQVAIKRICDFLNKENS